MAKAVIDVKPVIPTVSGAQANPEGEMDALLLGRTRVSLMSLKFLIKQVINLY